MSIDVIILLLIAALLVIAYLLETLVPYIADMLWMRRQRSIQQTEYQEQHESQGGSYGSIGQSGIGLPQAGSAFDRKDRDL